MTDVLSPHAEATHEAPLAQPMQPVTLLYGQTYVAKCTTNLGTHQMRSGDTFKVTDIQGITGTGWTFSAEITRKDGTIEAVPSAYMKTTLNPDVFAVQNETDKGAAAAVESTHDRFQGAGI